MSLHADPPWLTDPEVSLRARAVLALVERYDDGGGLTRADLEVLIGGGHVARREAIADAARCGYLDVTRSAPKKANQFSAVVYRLHHDGLRLSAPAGRKVKLYRHFDSHGTLLYVGICLSSPSRERQHARNSAWHCFSAKRTEEIVIGEDEAGLVEARTIRTEDPIFNFPGANEVWKLDRARQYFADRGRDDLWLSYVRGTSAEVVGRDS